MYQGLWLVVKSDDDSVMTLPTEKVDFMITKIFFNVFAIVALAASSMAVAGDKTPADETYETFAMCSSDIRKGGYKVEIRESTSSSNVLMIVEGFAGEYGDGYEFGPRRYFGAKADDVRDPIVLEYSFVLYDVLISTERSEDGTYPAELRIGKDNGETIAEAMTCKI